MSEVSTAKRLAKNTAFMYGRMIFLMIISLYTSRVVLKQLGVEDYGVYNLVGSVVAMFVSLRTIFAASTQRFLNYEMGESNNLNKLKTIFTNSLFINGIMALLFVVLVEVIGVWFLNNKINIDPSRLYAAKFVFQFSIISAAIGFIDSTFHAEIIAHERMDFFAYVSILDGILRLLIVFLLSYFTFDKLILYGFLSLCVSTIDISINIVYCKMKFKECRLSKSIDKSLLKQMMIFSGWNFLGTNAYILTQNGLNMVLNVFGGPLVNAARGIAYQVNSAVSQFINNIVVVINPYCIKTYASGNKLQLMKTIQLSSKILYLVQMCLIIPLIFCTEDILQIWLGIVPQYSVIFIQLILVYSLVRTLHHPLDTLFKAIGMLKQYQICESIMLVCPLILSYIALKSYMPYYMVFVFMIFFEIINLCCMLIIAKRLTQMSISSYFKMVALPCLLLGLVLVITYCVNYVYFHNVIISIFFSILVDFICVVIMFVIGLSKSEKSIFLNILSKK